MACTYFLIFFNFFLHVTGPYGVHVFFVTRYRFIWRAIISYYTLILCARFSRSLPITDCNIACFPLIARHVYIKCIVSPFNRSSGADFDVDQDCSVNNIMYL